MTSAHAADAGPRVGCDVQSVAPVAESMARLGDRYLRAVMGPEERAHLLRRSRVPAPESVAARFAAKESVLKILAPAATDAVPWPSIAVETTAHGAPRVVLTGSAAALAARQGLGNWTLSMSHDGDYALAVALALTSASQHSHRGTPDLTATTTHIFHQMKGVPSLGTTNTETTIRDVLATHGKLSRNAHDLAVDEDLYRAGMTSHASVNVMLALEDEFDFEFPEEMLTKATFTSIRSIAGAVEAIGLD